MVRAILAIMLATCFVAPVRGDDETPPPASYKTGRVKPTEDKFKALKAIFHANKMQGTEAFPHAGEAEWDSVAHGWINPIKHQDQCGSCYIFSGIEAIESAAKKAGHTDVVLSEQFFLDCMRVGGCGGGDNTSVLKEAKKNGVPYTRDYGEYRGHSLKCAFKEGMDKLKIDDWGLADGEVGYESVGSTQKIKDAVKACGSVGVAVAANGTMSNARPGEIFRGNARNINHEVAIVGWKPDPAKPGKVAWKVRNSWGDNWCDKGYIWMAEGANMIGTQPVFAMVKELPRPIPIVVATAFAPWLAVVLAVGLLIAVFFLGRRTAATVVAKVKRKPRKRKPKAKRLPPAGGLSTAPPKPEVKK